MRQWYLKRAVLVAVLVVAAAAMVWAGGQTQQTAATIVRVNPPGTLPIVDEMVTISVLTRYGAVEHDGNYRDAAFTQWFEDLTNVRMDFVDIVEGQMWTERLNLVLASGDLPEMIMNQHSFGGQFVYTHGAQGTFIPLDSLIEEWMPAYAGTLEKHPTYAAQLVMPDGKMYAIGSLEGTCYHCTMSRKMWIYTPWLETLGLDVPTTTEEFYRMLVAFRNDDPNRTGRADTIPITGAATGGWNAGPLSEYLMSSFIYTSAGDFLKRDGGRVSFVANTNEWREGIRYVRRLYREGLMQPDWFTQDAAQLRSTVESPGAAIVGAVPAGWFGVFSINSWEGSGRFADFHPIAPLVGPAGVRHTVFAPYAVQPHTVITNVARHPEVIARLNDWFFESIENRGIGHDWSWEGVNYRFLTEQERAEGRLLARDFSIADTVPLITRTYGEDRARDGWVRMAPGFMVGGGGAMPPEWAEDPTKQEWRLAEATRDLYEPYRPDHFIPPNLIVSEDLQDELAELRTLIIGVGGAPGLVSQFYAEFVTGGRDINSDSHWQTYVNELRRAGVDRYVEIMQQTLTAAGY